MAMGTVDVLMLGRLGRDALAGAGAGEAIFHWPALIGIGILLGIDTLVSQAFGAGDLKDCDHTLRQGVWLALFLTPPLIGLSFLLFPLLDWLNVGAETQEGARAYLGASAWGLLPLLLYSALRRYLQSSSVVKPITFTLISANLINVFFNWILIYGHLGAPAMGIKGSAWATNFARLYMAVFLAGYIWWKHKPDGVRPLTGPWRIDFARMKRLCELGFPAAGQIATEVGVFGAATLIAASLGTLAIAAHQVALNTAALTFMVPLGISSAAAVRVGQNIGANHPEAARRSGFSAFVLGCAFMSIAALSFLLLPRLILRAYIHDASVIDAGVPLLYLAAFFQLFDGAQVIMTGALRGLGNTSLAMYANIVCHWSIGLPLGWVLCFYAGLGIYGIWIGLTTGLILVGSVLFYAWSRLSRNLLTMNAP